MTHVTTGPSLAELGDRIGEVAMGHLDEAFRQMLGMGPQIVSDPMFVRLMTGKQHAFGNFEMLAADADEEDARRAMAPFRDCSGSGIVFYAGKQNAKIDEVAKECGLGTIVPFPAMAVDIDQLPPTALPEGYAFFRLGPGATLSAAWTVAFANGFGFPVDVGESFRPRIEMDDPGASLQFFAIRRDRDQQIVATSAVCLHGGIAGLYCVATIPEERKKGLGAHVTAEPLRIVRKLGYRVGVLQASKDGKPVYERLGFGTYGDAMMYMKSAE
jgi:hypothetical protein